MKLDKQTIVDLLKGQGDHEKASQAEAQLPDQVDSDQHGGLLQKLGIDPSDLMGKIPGLGGLGGGGQAPGSGGGGLGGTGLAG